MAEHDSEHGAASKRVVGRPFKKGESGNPGGRRKDAFGEYLRQQLGDGKELLDFWRGIIRNTAPGFEGAAEARDAVRASELLYKRAYGDLPAELQVAGPEGEGLQIIVQTLAGPKGET